MKVIKSVLTCFWAMWGFMWFLVIVLTVTPVYAILLKIFGERLVRKFIYFNAHYLAPLLMKLNLIDMEVYGAEKLDVNRTYMVVANHRAQVDILASYASLPILVKFLAKAEVKRIPLFGEMLRMIGLLVDRKSPESREKSVRDMVAELHKGYSIFIYPEGTRNRTDEPLKEFKDGAFRVAILAQVPIAVQTLVGTREINDPRKMHLAPGTIKVYLSDPIETTGMTLQEIPTLKSKVRNEMLKHL